MISKPKNGYNPNPSLNPSVMIPPTSSRPHHQMDNVFDTFSHAKDNQDDQKWFMRLLVQTWMWIVVSSLNIVVYIKSLNIMLIIFPRKTPLIYENMIWSNFGLATIYFFWLLLVEHNSKKTKQCLFTDISI